MTCVFLFTVVSRAASAALASRLAIEFLVYHGHRQTLVKLHRLPGPAEPLYVLGNGGSHRTHLSRILGLPWLFAATTLIPPPRKVEVFHVASGQDEREETTRLWQGLLDSGVAHGQLIGSDHSATLQLDYVPAP